MALQGTILLCIIIEFQDALVDTVKTLKMSRFYSDSTYHQEEKDLTRDDVTS